MRSPTRWLVPLLWAWLAAGPLVLLILALLDPIALGPGTLAEVGRAVESVDLRFVVAAGVALVWLATLVSALWVHRLRARGIEQSRLRRAFYGVVEGRSLPLHVDAHGTIPLRVAEPLRVPVEVDARLALDQVIEVEAQIPIRTTLPIDVDIETRILRLGAIKIPIRADIPLDVVLPIKVPMRIRTSELVVELREEVKVHLPPFEIPVAARLDVDLDLAASARQIESRVLGIADGEGRSS